MHGLALSLKYPFLNGDELLCYIIVKASNGLDGSAKHRPEIDQDDCKIHEVLHLLKFRVQDVDKNRIQNVLLHNFNQ